MVAIPDGWMWASFGCRAAGPRTKRAHSVIRVQECNPPAIITWHDLQLVGAIAEQTEGLRIVDLLAQWLLYNSIVLRERRSVPVSFETHVSERCVNGMPYLSSHERVVGARLFTDLPCPSRSPSNSSR